MNASSGADEPLNASEREELERLRRERAELLGAETSTAGRAQASGHRGLRWTGAAILLVLVVVLSFFAVLARYTHNEVLDSDRYVQTMASLGSNPVLQAELSDRITEEIVTRLDVEAVTADALRSIAEEAPRVPPAVVGLAPVIADEAESLVHRTVESFVASDRFEALWIEANRRAHERLVAVLTGDTRPGVEVSDKGVVSISLAPIIDRVRAALIDRGFAFANEIPTIDKSFVLFESSELATAQRATSALDKASSVLPWLVLLVAAAAVWVAPKGARRRAISLVGVSIAVAMALLAVAIAIGRSLYMGAVPADALSPQSAAVLIDTILVPLRTMLRAVFVLAVVVAVVGYLTGSSGSAVAVRGAGSKALDALRVPKNGRAPYPIESAVARFRVPLRVIIILIAVATLVFWPYPSGVVVVVTVLVAVAALVVVELIARPALVQHDTPDAAVLTGNE
ncbi:hypothetical protein QX204_10840 [Nocardia sp. PE-7]|uniref:hypothetical protein n=1 Tax=Nocardia sp. PE-7 TaxID=3058426 RepID=UPI0026584874|nr:hypothetical protein [Nocardia sp. PE-7]WKG11924.1 hypothetical protein QX204_10840 [Nocardia sp. PE-7]